MTLSSAAKSIVKALSEESQTVGLTKEAISQYFAARAESDFEGLKTELERLWNVYEKKPALEGLKEMKEDYFWTEIHGKKIFFALNTFFQANLFILPQLMEVLRGFPIWNKDKIFFDLYGGVGLFGLNVVDLVKEVYLIEENIFSIQLAHYNARHHALNNFFITEGRLEEKFSLLLEELQGDDHIAMIDPPRAGLSPSVVDCLNRVKKFKHLIYLSCDPETLIENCVELTKEEWQIKQVIPFDFFPRTRHLETLVLLERR
jgi:tRNA/tmRNA/rRNA uracil-C5-methylase (TrmA/RlmC/RlmD family)